MLHAYVFIGPRCWGFTHDETAANLPMDDGPWSFFRNALIPDEGAVGDDAAVAADLAAQGYALLQFR